MTRCRRNPLVALEMLEGRILLSSVQSLVTRATDGTLADQETGYPAPSLSADGRFVAFDSEATNLVPGDTNGCWDIFVHDRRRRTTERISLAQDGSQTDEDCRFPSLSADGRYVAFETCATLVPTDTTWFADIYAYDRQTETIERVSLGVGGVEGNQGCWWPKISKDGRFVAFESSASNLVAGDTNARTDAFLYDRQNDSIERASRSTGGSQANADCHVRGVSGNGRFVVFGSSATNLVAGDSNASEDVFVYDSQANSTERVSVADDESQGLAGSSSGAISANGRYVAFRSYAENLVPGDSNSCLDIFVRDRQAGTTERVSVTGAGRERVGSSDFPSLSANGRYVAFRSTAILVNDDRNGCYDIYVYDRQQDSIRRISVAFDGQEADGDSSVPMINADGKFVAFRSEATNLVAGDNNDSRDMFVWDRAGVADAAGNRRGDADDLGELAAGADLEADEFVSVDDPDDYFRFTPAAAGKVRLTLSGLAANADLYLYDNRGNLLKSSLRAARSAETITRRLGTNTYYVRVASAQPVGTDFLLTVARV